MSSVTVYVNNSIINFAELNDELSDIQIRHTTEGLHKVVQHITTVHKYVAIVILFTRKVNK